VRVLLLEERNGADEKVCEQAAAATDLLQEIRRAFKTLVPKELLRRKGKKIGQSGRTMCV